jgi:anti-anti-sigma regulatory factor
MSVAIPFDVDESWVPAGAALSAVLVPAAGSWEVRLSGELDSASLALVRALVEYCGARECRRLVIDLLEVRTLGLAAVTGLVGELRRARGLVDTLVLRGHDRELEWSTIGGADVALFVHGEQARDEVGLLLSAS